MIKLVKFFGNQYFWLGVIVILGLAVRLYKIDNPVADWHSWRQADTAAVARNFYKEGFNPFLPRGDDMSPAGNIAANPERYRFVEFPIYNSLVFFAYFFNGGVDEKLARLISALISLGSLIFVYLITRRHFNTATALLASLVFAFLPFNVYFSRVILPEPSLVFFSLGMFYFTERWIWEGNKWLFSSSVIFTAAAFLTKPTAIFYLIPLIYSFCLKEKRIWPIPWRYFFWGIISFSPFLGWRLWIQQHPEGIPAAGWLLNGDGIRFRPAFWRWIVGERFGREILGVTGSVLFVIGIIVKPLVKEDKLLHLFVLSSLAYLVVFATGNVMHDYYQTFIIPALSIFTARGAYLLMRGLNDFLPKIITLPLALFLLVLTFYLTGMEVKGLYQVNNGVIVEAGRAADKILPKDAVVIAPYNGDTAFLYQVNRSGWPILLLPAEELKQRFGAQYYISVNFDNDTNNITQRYAIIEKNTKFVIVDLTRENPNFVEKVK